MKRFISFILVLTTLFGAVSAEIFADDGVIEAEDTTFGEIFEEEIPSEFSDIISEENDGTEQRPEVSAAGDQETGVFIFFDVTEAYDRYVRMTADEQDEFLESLSAEEAAELMDFIEYMAEIPEEADEVHSEPADISEESAETAEESDDTSVESEMVFDEEVISDDPADEVPEEVTFGSEELASSAPSGAAGGEFGNGLTWDLSSDGVLSISGEGEMPQYGAPYFPWFFDAGSITSVHIGKDITSIGNYAFYDCRKMTSITIPKTVTYVGYYSFHNCLSLENVYYTGSKPAWKDIEIIDGNSALKKASVYYNWKDSFTDTSVNEFQIVVKENNCTADSSNEKDYSLSSNAVVYNRIGSSGETVTINVDKNGCAYVDLSEGNSVTVESAGYVSRTLNADKLRADNTVYLQKESDHPVISALWLERNDGSLIDLLHTEYSLNSEEEAIFIEPELDWGDSNFEDLMLEQENGAHHFVYPDKVSAFRPTEYFDLTSKITLYAKNDEGKITRKTVKLYASEYHNTMPEYISGFKFQFTDKIAVTLPESTGPLSNSVLSLGLFNPVPVEFEIDGDKWYAAIGYQKAGEKEGSGKWTPKTFAESVKDIKNAKKKLGDEYKAIKRARDSMKDFIVPVKGSWGFEADFCVMGFIEGTFDSEHSIVITSAGGYFLIEGSATYTKQEVAWVIPFYWEIGFEGKLQAQLTAIFENPYVAKTFTTNIDIKPEIAVVVGAGVGVVKILTLGGGFKGTLSADWKLNSSVTKYFQLKGTINGFLKAKALWLEYEYPFEPIFDEILYEYWGPEDFELPTNLLAGSCEAYDGSENLFITDESIWCNEESYDADYDCIQDINPQLPIYKYIYRPSEYRPSDIGYLNAGSVFVPARNDSAFLAGGIRLRETEEFILNAYSEADPQVASFSDGRKVAVWIGLDDSAFGYNKLQLFYSYYSNGSWSEPRLVDGNGTPDAYPALEVINDRAYLVWTDFSGTVSDSSTLDDIAGMAEISAAVFDTETCRFNGGNITTGSNTLNLNPVICGDENAVYAVWLRNGGNDWFGRNGRNSFMCSSFDGTAWGSPAAVVENLNPVIDFDADCIGGTCHIAYSMDTDSDLSTLADVEIFLDGVQYTFNEHIDSGVVYHNGEIYWLADGSVMKDDIRLTPEGMDISSDRFQVVDANGRTMIVYTETDGICSSLKAVYRNGDWGCPVVLSDSPDSSVRYFSATSNADGSLSVLMEKQEIIGDGTSGDPYGYSEIAWFNAPEACDITLDDVTFDSAEYIPDGTLNLLLNISNNSVVTVNGLKVSVKDMETGTVTEYTLDTVLYSGSTGTFTVGYPLADVRQGRQLTVTVLPLSCQDMYPDDNSYTVALSRRNILIEHLQIGTTRGGSYVISANVTNFGYSSSENTKVMLMRGTPDSVPIQTIYLGTIMPLKSIGVSFTVDDPQPDAYYVIALSDLDEHFYGDNEDFVVIGESVFDTVKGFSADRNYIIIRTDDDPVQLNATIGSEELKPFITWEADNSDNEADVISVNSTGLVTPINEGTAYAVAIIEYGGIKFTSRCRVDVVAGSTDSAVTGVSLPKQKATVELFSTDYARFNVLLEMDRLLKDSEAVLAGAAKFDLIDKENLAVESPAGGYELVSARFMNETVGNLFALRVIDDRTLEIVPEHGTLEKAQKKSTAIKASYTSPVVVTLRDGTERTTAKSLTITVKQSVPVLKAKAIKLNSYGGCLTSSAPIMITGGVVDQLEPDFETAKKYPKKSTGDWLNVDYDSLSVSLKNGIDGSRSGTLYMRAVPEGWAVKVPVTVTVSASVNAPKITFKTPTLTLKPGTYDRQSTAYTITPSMFANPMQYPVEVTRITEGSGAGKKTYGNCEVIDCRIEDGMITVRPIVDDWNPHTYNVYVSVAGRESSFTVKTLSAKAMVKMSLKQTGTIEVKLPNSCAVLKAGLSNYHVGGDETFNAKVFLIKSKTNEILGDVTDWFDVFPAGNAITVSIADEHSLDVAEHFTGYSYSLEVTAEIGEKQAVSDRTRLNIKYTKTLVPAVSLKASGAIDVLRPGTSVTITPTVKNNYTYELKAENLEFFIMNGKKYKPIGHAEDEIETVPFDVDVDEGRFIVTANDSAETDSSLKYGVRLRLYDGSGTEICVSGGKDHSPTSFTVKMGAVKVNAKPAAVQLLAKDRFSTGTFSIETSDDRLSGIDFDRTKLTGNGSGNFYLRHLGNGEYAIGFKDNTLPSGKNMIKSGMVKTLKLNVYMIGNNTTKPNKTIEIRVSIR